MRHYLQSIIDNIPFKNMPAKWQGFSAKSGSAPNGDFARFSKTEAIKRTKKAAEFSDFCKQGGFSQIKKQKIVYYYN
jgi:hypothetical protein